MRVSWPRAWPTRSGSCVETADTQNWPSCAAPPTTPTEPWAAPSRCYPRHALLAAADGRPIVGFSFARGMRAPSTSAPAKLTPARVTCLNSAPWRHAPVNTAPRRSASRKVAPRRLASRNDDPSSAVPSNRTPAASTPSKSVPRKFSRPITCPRMFASRQIRSRTHRDGSPGLVIPAGDFGLAPAPGSWPALVSTCPVMAARTMSPDSQSQGLGLAHQPTARADLRSGLCALPGPNRPPPGCCLATR